jgi:uncharacterized low-complexity protein
MKTKFLSLFAALILSAGLSMGSVQAAENPFGMSDLDTVQQLSMSSKPKDGKCGEGKCGGSKKEGKCGEGKCGDSKKKKDGKCGEGKCGDSK